MNLNDYFKSINLQFIQDYVTSQRQEDLHLEFKSAPNGMDKAQKLNFAKALSGFANSDGGILVWGIEAKRVDGVDAAESLAPIKEIRRFLSELNSYTGQYVNPLVDGVDHKIIPEPQNPETGYAVTIIPGSDSGPHMAKCGEDRYYKRSGDSFHKLEHYEIADLFGRRPRATLDLHHKPTFHDRRVSVEVGIENLGRGPAHYPYLELEVNSPYTIGSLGAVQRVIINGMSPLEVSGFSTRHRAFAPSGHPIVYPNGILLIAKVELKLPEAESYKVPDLEMNYTLCCEGLPLQHGNLTLAGMDLESAPSN